MQDTVKIKNKLRYFRSNLFRFNEYVAGFVAFQKSKIMSKLDQILVTVVTINEKSQKRDPNKSVMNLGIPEQTKRSAMSKVTQVKPIRKYFWSKRSEEYLQKKEKARQEQKARVSKPREFISAMVQNWALTDVLSQVHLYFI